MNEYIIEILQEISLPGEIRHLVRQREKWSDSGINGGYIVKSIVKHFILFGEMPILLFNTVI